uniref:Glabrous enhancer-binding protein-like DBD domain-containing protein n=1 Tax=Ananas comosus var. bracteatus TaxID=296719 RepID=A0A6V7PSH8_ANACO|nr:unnamed protein product [Ananas comosus var. bracteatus]
MRRQLPLDFSKSQLVEKLRRLKKKYLNCVARLRSAADSFAFRSPHEQALFEIARNIWTPSSDPNPDPDPANPIINNSDSDRKPPRSRSRRQQQRQQRRLRRATAAAAAAAAAAEDPIPVPVPVPVSVPVPITVTAENPTPKPPPATPAAASDLSPLLFKELVGAAIGGPLLGFGGGGSSVSNLGDGRWRKQQILELEVYLKRLELLREHIESTLRELKGSSGGA